MSATNDQQNGGGTTSGSTSSFVTALVTSVIILSVQGALFLYFHTRQKNIYQPRTFLLDEGKQPKPLPANPLKWLLELWRIHPDSVLAANGLDAYVFVRLLRMFLLIFLPFWFLTWAILMPITAVKPNNGQSGLNMFVIGNVGLTVQSRLGAHLVVAWLFIAWIFFLLWREHGHFNKVRHEYLASPEYQQQARARTVLITKIPKKDMNESFVRELASEHGTVERVWLVRDVKQVNDVYEERQKACTKLEGAEGKLLQFAAKRIGKGKATLPTQDPARAEDLDLIKSVVPDKKRPTQRLGKLAPIFIGKKVDAIEHNIGEIQRTEKELAALREQPENYALGSSAIVRFATQAAAVAFVQSRCKGLGQVKDLKSVKGVSGLGKMPRFGDIAPENIYWRNLGIDYKTVPGRIAISWGLTIGLILIWAIPIAFAGSLSNLSGLCTNVTWLSWVCTLPAPVVGIIQGAAPPIAIAILFMLLPIVLRIFAKIQGLPTIPLLDRSVFDRYFLFLIIHGFLIVTVASSLTSGLSQAIKNPDQAPSILATKLPQSSIYFLTFLITSAIGAAAGYLFQLVPVLKLIIFRFLGGATPRKIHKLERTMPAITYVQLLPNVSLLVVLGIVYSVIQPIMAALATVACFLYFIAFKYLFVYVFQQPIEQETGGSWFRKAVAHIFVGCYISEICLIGLFFLSSNERNERSAIPEGALMVVLLIATIAYQQYLKWRFHPDKVVLEKVPGAKEPQSNTSYQPDKAEPVQDYEAIKEAHGFEPPSMWTKQPVLWIARDQHGLAEREVRKIKDAGLTTSLEMADMNDKGQITVTGDPKFLDEP